MSHFPHNFIDEYNFIQNEPVFSFFTNRCFDTIVSANHSHSFPRTETLRVDKLLQYLLLTIYVSIIGDCGFAFTRRPKLDLIV